MALWQNATTHETWDDGDTFAPGEAGFSTDKVAAKWAADGFNYMGTPNWMPPPQDAQSSAV